ncbi:hypothetical protein [Mesorhizobium sp. SARCC-RB16n]|uniref:hypothetical protein n=1 Tax=Mesorhizobium sp. SARCC-RB16n TaxID=2116687 RepID=UPI00122EE33C|nr:hypothetical protein [Mesorhizobium sp. SARCC-RB16n]
MDLAAGVTRLVADMNHSNEAGEFKVLTRWTGHRAVGRIITNLGVLGVVDSTLQIVELSDGVREIEFRNATEATIVN